MTRYKRPPKTLLMPYSDGEFVLYTEYAKVLDSVQKIKRHIIEWKKGCTNATDNHPEECGVCTLELIDSIECTINNITTQGG